MRECSVDFEATTTAHYANHHPGLPTLDEEKEKRLDGNTAAN
jgi:hypothetical protein